MEELEAHRQHTMQVIRPETSWRVVYGPGNVNNHVRHIRAIVDDAYIVYRVWSKRRGWRYHVEWWYSFHLLLRDKVIKRA